MSTFTGLWTRLTNKPGEGPVGDDTTPAATVATPPADRPDTDSSGVETGGFALDEHQQRYFHTFGFLKVPGLFRDQIARIEDGFEHAIANNEPWETTEPLHFDERRQIIPDFLRNAPQLAYLAEHPRVVSIVSTLIGPDYVVLNGDGNIFSCDTSWHPDNYQAPMEIFHLKLSFYLDRLDGDSGAIRMLPGTNDWQNEYARGLRRSLNDPAAIQSEFGVAPDEIPSWTIETEPGDVVIWNYRTIHASFNGGKRRRLFSLNFRAP